VDSDKREQLTIDAVLARLDVQRQGTTSVIDIAFTSKVPAKAALIANAFASAYLQDKAEAKLNAVKQMTGSLTDRLAALQVDASKASTDLEAYKAKNNLTDIGSSETLTQQELSQLDQQLQLARADLAAEEARLSTAKSQLAKGSNGEDLGEALSSPVVQSLRSQRAIASQKVGDMQGRYGERHPDLLRAKRELAAVDSQIQEEVRRIVSSLESQVRVARDRVSSLEASIARTKEALVRNNLAGAHASVMNLNAQSSSSLYQAFLERMKQSAAVQGMEPSDARVVSPAMVPTSKSSPKTTLNLALGLVLGLLLGAIAVAIAEAMHAGFTSEDEVENGLGYPLIGVVPTLAATADRGEVITSPVDYVVENPRSAFTESFRAIRASLLLRERAKVIAITSAIPSEGKTTTAICLSRVSAQAGSRTVLVDCDLVGRGVNTTLGIQPKLGLIDVLLGQARLEDVLLHDPKSGAYILPAGSRLSTPVDLLNSTEMHRVLAQLGDRFDFVFLDTSPILLVSDARAIVRQADSVLMVTRWRRTPRRMAEACAKAVALTDADVAGTILSRADHHTMASFRYGHYYQRGDSGLLEPPRQVA
jgi:capsular exopolysaccharide synthesis family protein